MKAQRAIHAQKTTLFLTLLVTCVAAFVASKTTATAQAADQTAVTQATCLRFPPGEGRGTDEGVQPPPPVPCDTLLRFRLAPVNTSGVIARSKTFAHVDESGHTVNAKGARVGGAHDDS